MKVYVAGHNGLVGRALTRAIEAKPDLEWIGATRSELDLLDSGAVQSFLEKNSPDLILMAAAKVGGIGANDKYPVEFLLDNLTIQNNIMKSAHEVGIKKLVFLGSSCIYPKFCQQPIKEEYLLTGELEPTNDAYAIAKIAGIKLIQSYRKEYGHSWISVMPTNLYGPDDNFNAETSHVLPAMISKFHKAKLAEEPHVVLWGSGKPRREFLHVDDMAAASVFVMQLPIATYQAHTNSLQSHLNVGFGSDITIFELANAVAKAVGYKQEISFDSSKPDGAPRKWMDSSRINALGWRAKVRLEEGLSQAYTDFLKVTP